MPKKNIAGEPGRLDALVDGVFAIVLTLLVIEFKVPEVAEDLPVTSKMVLEELAHLSPLFYSYLISFFVIASYWTIHHRISATFKKCDSNLVKKTFTFLLGISLLPFTTHIQGKYGEIPLGFSVYSLNVCFCGFSLLSLWSYAKTEIVEKIPEELGKLFKTKLFITSFIFLASAPISFIDLGMAKLLWIALFFVSPALNKLKGWNKYGDPDSYF